MMSEIDHIRGHTVHARKGGPDNRFRYGVDYVLFDAEAPAPRRPRLFSRNGRNLASVRDRDHGGPPGKGRGATWVREQLDAAGVPAEAARKIELLTQPRVLGYVFNPVSFWLVRDGEGALRAVIAEVTNTFGDRHSYLCRHPDLAPITPRDELTAEKLMHVSPFQPVAGGYRFRFDIGAERIAIRIGYSHGNARDGVIATLTGPRAPLTNRGLLGALLRRPAGPMRVMALIHWQALKLWAKGARYRPRPAPPGEQISH